MAYTTIDDPSEYFTITLYTGNGNDNRAITNSANAGDFQPDWLWYKERSSTSEHRSFDSTRGASKRIEPNNTNTEATDTSNHKSFDSNGFTVGTSGSTNANGDTYVAWQWKCNGGTTSSLTAGTIDATVQANTTSKLSIGIYSGNNTAGATVEHGLGVKPDVLFIKNRSDGTAHSWAVYHSAIGATYGMQLNGTDVKSDNTVWFNDTEPTTSVFSVGASGSATNASGSANNRLFYAMASVKGYSKFGGYKGNGHATDGPFVYLGFKPAWLLYRNVDRAENWIIVDNKRNPTNRVAGANLQANVGDAEQNETRWGFDFLSNGFKVRQTQAQNANNGNGETIIYMAFAESPFVSSEGVPTTAR